MLMEGRLLIDRTVMFESQGSTMCPLSWRPSSGVLWSEGKGDSCFL